MIGVELWRKCVTFFGGKKEIETAGSVGGVGSGTSSTETEFSAEVVRVTRILPHPNADKLELARFEMKGIGETAYEVVVQKGQYRPGDLAAYFSVDCLLPTSHPDFRFLLDRLDGKGKDVYRLRAARLRGVFSQGLLVPIADGPYGPGSHYEFGQQVADECGVTYYRAPEPGMGGGAPGKSSQKQPFPIYTVDSLKKLPRLFEEGERVCITEKIHGTNFRFGWVPRKVLGIRFGWKFVVGSHRAIKEVGNSRDPGWYGEDVWSDAADGMDLAWKTKDYKGHTFYGELYGYTYSGKKIQDLTYGRKPTDGPGLVIFDVLDDEGKWLDPWTRRNLCADLELDHVPVISAGPEVTTMPFSKEYVEMIAEGYTLVPSHEHAPLQIREGVVVESAEGVRRKAKYVSQGYLLRTEPKGEAA